MNASDDSIDGTDDGFPSTFYNHFENLTAQDSVAWTFAVENEIKLLMSEELSS